MTNLNTHTYTTQNTTQNTTQYNTIQSNPQFEFWIVLLQCLKV
jgi:hypothetical protein